MSSSHRKSIAVTVFWSARLSVSWIACNQSSMPLLCNRRKYEHVIPLLRDVFPVPLRVEFKICFLVYTSLHRAAPGYLHDYCSSTSGLRLRSTDKCYILVRRMKTRFGYRAFSAAGPRCWIRLPLLLCVHHIQSILLKPDLQPICSAMHTCTPLLVDREAPLYSYMYMAVLSQ